MFRTMGFHWISREFDLASNFGWTYLRAQMELEGVIWCKPSQVLDDRTTLEARKRFSWLLKCFSYISRDFGLGAWSQLWRALSPSSDGVRRTSWARCCAPWAHWIDRTDRRAIGRFTHALDKKVLFCPLRRKILDDLTTQLYPNTLKENKRNVIVV